MAKINEDHKFSREEKIDYILKNGESVYGDNLPSKEELEQADDSKIDEYYQEIEKNLRSAGINEYNSIPRKYVPDFDSFIKETELPLDGGTKLPNDKESAVSKLKEFLNHVQEYSSNNDGIITDIPTEVGKSKSFTHLYGFSFNIKSANTINDIEVQVIFNSKEGEYIYAIGDADTNDVINEEAFETDEEFYQLFEESVEDYGEENDPDVLNEINMWDIRGRDTMDFESFMKTAKKGSGKENLKAKDHHSEFLNKSFKSTDTSKGQDLSTPKTKSEN